MERFPGIRSAAGLLDGEVREIKDKAGEEDWYIYDLFFRPGEGKEIYVRGVISVTESEESFQTILRIAFILLPLLAAATAFVGYRFTKRTLKPVKDITDTVCKIRMDADLSRRIDNIDTVRETKEKRYKKTEMRFISLRRRLTRCWMSWKPCLKEKSSSLRTFRMN
ncbi:hypothetical protein M5E84_12170 [[Ruminococcus] torques]|nr:hypothetical protein M5E84_12170 [[Ruminococcus] torques]